MVLWGVFTALESGVLINIGPRLSNLGLTVCDKIYFFVKQIHTNNRSDTYVYYLLSMWKIEIYLYRYKYIYYLPNI